MSQHVLIVGGGVVGAMCAYYLNRDGARVTMIDQAVFGSACSHGNCGYVCPSHALPLTQPGMVRKNMFKAMSKKSALYVKPRLSWSLMKWMTKFALRCNQKDMMQAAGGLHALLQSSRTLYDEVIRDAGISCDWESQGLLFVYRDQSELDHYDDTARMLQAEFGIQTEKWTRETAIEREPALKPESVAGGYWFPGDAHLRPDRLMSELRRVLEQKGVKIIDNCKVTSIDRSNGVAISVQTSQGAMTADQYIFATGALTPMLNQYLGCTIPIQPGKGYSITMPRPSIAPKYPIIFEQDHVAITPWASGYRIGSTMEFSGYDTTMNMARIDNLRRGAAIYLREPFCEPTIENWYGWRPMTWDSLPVIDRSPTMSNVIIAAGHNMLGLSLATGTGKLITEMVHQRIPHIDISPYRVSRF